MSYKNSFLRTKKILETRIQQHVDEIEDLPNGSLHIYNMKLADDNYFSRYYQVVSSVDENGHKHSTRSYIPRNKIELAVLLERKKLLQLELGELRKEVNAIELYLSNCSNENSMIDKIESISRRSGEKELLDRFYSSRRSESEEVLKWKASIRVDPPYKPEGLKFQSKANIKVRSKGEQILVGALYDHDVPFVYEPTLILPDGTKFVPDTIALNTRTWQVYIIEHFGMLDNPEYAARVGEKLNKYATYGYIPFVNFIPTFESANSGIDELWLEQIIQYFLL